MSHPPSSDPLQRLVGLIRDRTGNVIPPSRQPFLEEVAARRAVGKGMGTVEDYVRALEAEQLPAEWAHLIPLITIKESYFFRAPQQWEVIRKQVLPELLRARGQARQLRIWSAASARGEEPATLAMILAEEPSLDHIAWSILATDVDDEALAGARLGLYGDRAVGQVPPELLERYFSRRGKLYELSTELRARISYLQLNLAHPPYSVPFPEVDLILLRNVLIYFRRPLQRRVVQQVGTHLARDGYLFLGASETLWQVQEELEPVDLGSCFCYRHRRAAEEVIAPPVKRMRTSVAHPPATRREPAAQIREAPVAQPKTPVPQPLSVQERLLAAARHLAGNQIEEAGRAIEQVLAVDPSEPAAHALEGFLHDVTGRTDDAVASYRAALYLDPELYQVRMLLADCLLRLGNRDRAEHQYREVLAHLGNGRERNLVVLGDLPFPDRTRAQRRCRQVLGGG
ncbi:MAG TPA: CheR family methyltransferase [Thermoanaerobaculia bacterium]|nr:CheR family methyltransferase [Thermoanaerobaculia bacterium]